MVAGMLGLVINDGMIWAQEKIPPFFRSNAVAIKLGYHMYVDSDYTDYWKVKKEDYNGFAFELAYERELIRYLGLEIALGAHKGDQEYHYMNLVYAGDRSSLKTWLQNAYLSLSLKPHFPLGNYFHLYLGTGPDVCYNHIKTEGDYERGGAGIYINRSEGRIALGVHGLAGLEVLLLRDPAKFGIADMPMSLFLEYKYSYIPVKEVDDKVVKDINSFAGSSVSAHDLDVGGHMFFLGFRWRF